MRIRYLEKCVSLSRTQTSNELHNRRVVIVAQRPIDVDAHLVHSSDQLERQMLQQTLSLH